MFGLSDTRRAIIELEIKTKREDNGMNAINTNERKADNSKSKNKFWSVLKKVLLYTLATIAVVLALVVLYKILEFLFVAAILLIAWVGIVPRRWR